MIPVHACHLVLSLCDPMDCSLPGSSVHMFIYIYIYIYIHTHIHTSQVAQVIKKKKPTCQCRRHKGCKFQPWVREDPLEEGMATHSSILAWRIPWTDELGRLQSIGSQKNQTWLKQPNTHSTSIHRDNVFLCVFYSWRNYFLEEIRICGQGWGRRSRWRRNTWNKLGKVIRTYD